MSSYQPNFPFGVNIVRVLLIARHKVPLCSVLSALISTCPNVCQSAQRLIFEAKLYFSPSRQADKKRQTYPDFLYLLRDRSRKLIPLEAMRWAGKQLSGGRYSAISVWLQWQEP